MTPEIDPKRLYSFAEAAELIPGSHGHIRVVTLHRWRRAGVFRAEARPGPAGMRCRWFVWGSELLKLLPDRPADASTIRSPGERRRGMEAARETLIEHGVIGGE